MIFIRSLINLSKSKTKGFAAVLAAAFVPIVMFGLSYLVKYTQKSDTDTKRFETPYIIGKNIAQSFNPGKTWDEQKDCLYSIGAQIYNDEFSKINKGTNFSISNTAKTYKSQKNLKITGLYDFYKNYSTNGRNLSKSEFIDNGLLVSRAPFSDIVYNEGSLTVNYIKNITGSGNRNDLIYSVNEYKKSEEKLKISLDEKGKISVVCGKLNRKAEVRIPRSDVDIVIAIPTNRASNTPSNSNTANFGTYTNKTTADSTPIRQIARACQAFLKPFLHTAGVAVGIIPYSGKVTMSPYSDYASYTTQMEMNSNAPSLPYAMQAMFYGSDGKAGGDIVLLPGGNATLAYGDYKNWGSSTIGLPIMARRGKIQTYRGMKLYSGSNGQQTSSSLLLDMTSLPTKGDEYKFMKMNTNPCYFGFCNLLAMTCERDCPTYMANPYFMTELTSDIQGLIHDLELFVPFKDEKNKSNFLFLPIVMAGNMFNWGSHPSELPKTGRVPESPRTNKARAVIIIANAPDNFEPQELTYLGFNNDYSEIPMIESDTILFNKDRGYAEKNGTYMGTKGVVYFSTQSGTGNLTNSGYLLTGDSTARISFPSKGLIKVVAEREDPGTIIVYNDNGVTENLGETTFLGSKTLNFSGPQQVSNYSDLGTLFKSGYYTTNGPNFGNNLSTKKVKIKFAGCKLNKATISNQILRFYSSYDGSLVENNSGSVWSGGPAAMKKKMDPCIDPSENYNDLTNGQIINHTSSSTQYYDCPYTYPCTETVYDKCATNVPGVGTVYSNCNPHQVSSTCTGTTQCSRQISTNYSTAGWLFNSNGYINAYDFKPKCYGVSKLNRFVMAADGFTDSAIVADNATINYNSSWKNIGSVKYDTSSGKKYRSYTGTSNYPSSAGYSQVSTGNFQIESYYYYKLFSSKKYRTRSITQLIDTYRSWPAAPQTSAGSYSSSCCSTVWSERRVPKEVPYTCKKQREESYDCKKQRQESYDCKKTSSYPCVKEVWDSSGCSEQVSYDCSTTYRCKTGTETEYYDCPFTYPCTKTEYDQCESNVPGVGKIYSNCNPHEVPSTCDGITRCSRQVDVYGTCTNPKTCCCKTRWYGCYVNKSTTCYSDYWDTCYKTVDYWDTCSKTVEYDGTCYRTEYETKYDDAGNNDSVGCEGVCWQHYLAAPSGWSASDNYQEVTCNKYVPSTRYQRKYTTTQEQYSNTCSFSDGATDNCSCTWPSISASTVANYSRADCSQCSSSCSTSGSVNNNIGNWSTPSTSEQKRFYSFYKRNPDGSTATPTFEICNSSGHTGCSSTSYNGSPKGTLDSSLTQKSPYRYNLYNFFFVSGDSAKSNTFSYSNNTLTSKISSESDSNLIQNKGVYLLPSEEANTYWVCFCGDANLQLNFTEATDASITFSNIKNVNYNLSLDDAGSIKQTIGLNKNSIDTREVFYIHPDQIKDNQDSDGNYYVDIATTGKTRIVSIEITNRPLITDNSSNSSSDIEIVGKDSSGGIVVGDSNTNVEFKVKRKTSFTINAAPAYFWIEGQSDFRQTSGTARICGNSNKFAGVVRATVPDGGSGKITIESEQPIAVYKKSDTDVWVNQIIPNYSYKITTDRKLKSINISSFIAPKVSFSGGVPDKSYTFCSKEVENTPDQKLFDWASSSMSHVSSSNTASFKETTFKGGEKNLNFNLTACKLISAQAENLNMLFSPQVNDFSQIRVKNKFGDYIYVSTTDGFYVKRGGNEGWETEIQLDITNAYNIYGEGTIGMSAYRSNNPTTLTLFTGNSNSYWGTGNARETVSTTGLSNSQNTLGRMYERVESKSYKGINYLSSFYYQVQSYDLMKRVNYTTNNTSNHNYVGKMPFNGVGNIRVYVQPQKVKTSNYSRNMSDSEITSNVFGNYVYTFSENNRLLNLNNENLTKANNSFVLLYSTGSIGGTSISAGGYKDHSVTPTSTSNGYYYTDINVNNVMLTLPSSKISYVGSTTLISREGTLSEEQITISPDDYSFESKSDGYYYVKVPCRNVYISKPKLTDIDILYYAHPNIIKEDLKNTRIIDGYDQATNKNMKKYGNINYDNASLPSVSAVQQLFYYSKPNSNEVYIYPKASGTGPASAGEEGDFFIQLWDHNNEAPAVRWKIGSSIQSSTSDINMIGSGFGPFKSNYAFNGLHRMFFPYDIYNKNYGGYSYALNSALVFTGYTLPINLILASNGYQQTYPLSSGNVSNYTKPNDALSNLAKDACSKLKTSLNTVIFLIKYRTNSTLSLESCVDGNQKYTVNNEEDLINTMKTIASIIKEGSEIQELTIDVKNIK